MASNREIEVGAKAIAEDLRLPGGRLKKLARVVADHMDWFDAAAARGMTWQDTVRVLAAAGATGKDGKPLRIGTLSSTVWRERAKIQSAEVPSDSFGQEFYLRKLAKHGVKLISITQPLGNDDDPAQAMMRKVIALFDEYQSKENAKHVLRNMKLNAEQNFWNGATVPLGYKLVEVEKRGTKIKKTLAVDPVEAETVRLLFNLYLHGDGMSGAMGIKEMVKWLNSRGYRTRKGNTFGVGMLHRMLTNTEVQPDLISHRQTQSRE